MRRPNIALTPAYTVIRQGNSELQNAQVYLHFDNTPDALAGYFPWHMYNLTNWLVNPGLFMAGLAQYNVTPGRYAGYDIITLPTRPNGQLFDAWLRNSSYVGRGITNAVHVLFFGAGKAPSESGFAYGVQYCAYHGQSPDGINYVVCPLPAVAGDGCVIGSIVDTVGFSLSHELVETLTDANPGNGFVVQPQNIELDDVQPCAGTPLTVWVGGYAYKIEGYWRVDNGVCWST